MLEKIKTPYTNCNKSISEITFNKYDCSNLLKKKYKSALITGAASGIGYSVLKKLRHEKIKVLALDK